MPPTYKRKNNGMQRLCALNDAETGMPKLTLKQEKFVHGLINGLHPKEAYKQAYDASGMKEESISVEVCKLRNNPKIARAISIFQRNALDSAVITRESHLAQLARGREIAYELGQASAGIQAEHYRGRVAGLYNDKMTLNIGPTDEALLSQLATMLGPDIAKVIGENIGTSPQLIDYVDESPLDSHNEDYGKE